MTAHVRPSPGIATRSHLGNSLPSGVALQANRSSPLPIQLPSNCHVPAINYATGNVKTAGQLLVKKTPPPRRTD